MSFEKTIQQASIVLPDFVLRPVRDADVGLLSLYAGDKRVSGNTSTIPHPLPPGATEAFVARAQAPDRKEDVWVVDGTNSGQSEVLGVVALERMDRDQSEIGYWVAPAMWNTGIASAAVEALVDANPQACRTIFGTVFQDNPASARVLTNANFTYIGEAESYSVARAATVKTWTYLRKLD